MPEIQRALLTELLRRYKELEIRDAVQGQLMAYLADQHPGLGLHLAEALQQARGRLAPLVQLRFDDVETALARGDDPGTALRHLLGL